MHTDVKDEELIRLVQTGDESAFTNFGRKAQCFSFGI